MTLFPSAFFIPSSSRYFPSKFLTGILLALGFATQIQAQNPKISIQGTLRAANGTSVNDGTYNVTFKFYRTESGGTALWEETAPVDVVGSIYSHYLGSVTPLNAMDFDSTIYLGVVVNNYELVPRTELSYSPYAFSVAVAQRVVCSGAVGDVKYSILNPTQFAQQNGDCWVPMDGRSITGSKLAMITGASNIPDGGGLFIRAQEFSGSPNHDSDRNASSPIATLQQDDFKSHTHTISTDGEHTHGVRYGRDNGDDSNETGQNAAGDDYGTDYVNQTNPAGSHTHTIGNTGGAETRPKNLNFWIYIRIN